jgi:hypothetical protein
MNRVPHRREPRRWRRRARQAFRELKSAHNSHSPPAAQRVQPGAAVAASRARSTLGEGHLGAAPMRSLFRPFGYVRRARPEQQSVPVYVVRLRPERGVEPIKTLRIALKILLHRFGLRVLSVEEVER